MLLCPQVFEFLSDLSAVVFRECCHQGVALEAFITRTSVFLNLYEVDSTTTIIEGFVKGFNKRDDESMNKESQVGISRVAYRNAQMSCCVVYFSPQSRAPLCRAQNSGKRIASTCCYRLLLFPPLRVARISH